MSIAEAPIVGDTTGYVPQPKQLIAHTCPADELLYGGQAGGGKSAYLLNEFLEAARTSPGSHVILFRRIYRELQQLIDRSREIVPASVATWNEKQGRYTFHHPDGPDSYMTFSHLQLLDDVYSHMSNEYDLIGFDEATHFIPRQVQYLRSRNRAPKSRPNAWPRMRMTSNPGNIGHKYMLETFVRPPDRNVELVSFNMVMFDPLFDVAADPACGWRNYPPGTRGEPQPYIVWRPEPSDEERGLNIQPRTRCFIPATLEDNVYIDSAYKATLTALPESEKQGLLYGNWDSFEGMFFSEFSEDVHVIDPISPPASWRKFRAIDHGFADPLACLWFAVDPDTEQIVIYNELYQSGLHDTEACSLINAMTPATDHIDYTVADKTMWRGSSNDQAMSLEEIYRRNGIHLIPANNDRIAGWSNMRRLLAINPKTEKPGLVITKNCRNLIYEIQNAVHDERRQEDVDPRVGDDHALDAARYGLLSRGTFITKRRNPIRAGVFRR